MPAPLLDYSQLPPRRDWRQRLYGVLSVLGVLVAAYAAYLGVEEYRLRREAAALAAANAPQQKWKAAADIRLRPDATLLLPDGRVGRLIEMAPRPARAAADGAAAPRPAVALAVALQRLRADDVGCTVVRTGDDGLPLVQIWARSPRAYLGMCGHSSRAEFRRGRMRLWRNVGFYLVDRNEIEPSSEARLSTASVIGY